MAIGPALAEHRVYNPAQIDNVFIILHIGTAENIAASLLYDSILSDHLEEMDREREREERAAAQVDFAELLSAEQTRFDIQPAAKAAKHSPSVGPRTKEQPGDAPPSGKLPVWLPKKEYMTDLAAGRASQPNETKRKPSPRRSRSMTTKRREHSNKRTHPPKRATTKRHRRSSHLGCPPFSPFGNRYGRLSIGR